MHASIWVLGRAGLPRSSLWPYSALAVVDTLQKELQMGALSLILMTCPMPNNELGFSSIKVQAQTQRSKSNTTTGVRPSLASGSLGTYGNLYRRRQRYQNQTWEREQVSMPLCIRAIATFIVMWSRTWRPGPQSGLGCSVSPAVVFPVVKHPQFKFYNFDHSQTNSSVALSIISMPSPYLLL